MADTDISKPKLEIYSKTGKKFIIVKVGTDDHPATTEDFDKAREMLKDVSEAAAKDFNVIFVPHTIKIEALVLDHLQ